ncbi:hypothetical protein B0T20DRAFT_351140 [Sordaria brevicollis]|uniref:C2H2-type domain-containing protein n=1 Tax=Sordaria brevicollis TaxID=83679 RepID=A0AAE0PG09_SORBR|nr:hypothetical protein B0T20DRAFT_351140 [Sordaria brevicollis]
MSGILRGEKLIEAINAADESTVRTVLRGLCADDEVEKLVGKHLYQVANLITTKAGTSDSKRKATASVHICVRCGNAFDENDNKTKKECRYHPEEMEIDDSSSAWYDWDEDAHGEKDTPENRRTPHLLRGYIYYCCEKRADESEGCKLGYHKAVDGKRGKYDFDDDDDDEEEEDDDEEDVEDDKDDEEDE